MIYQAFKPALFAALGCLALASCGGGRKSVPTQLIGQWRSEQDSSQALQFTETEMRVIVKGNFSEPLAISADAGCKRCADASASPETICLSIAQKNNALCKRIVALSDTRLELQDIGGAAAKYSFVRVK